MVKQGLMIPMINTNYIHIDENHFYIASLLKTTRPGFHQHPWNSGDTDYL